ncbi:hypothetical protein DEIPH_ctg060orf0015 [Deinococcus phoenicis]|uniref:Uncharacterized protein n=1 Tax=Deinococcus phoenicis TaxID=1476583 RepID=A0A016QMD6_9DEIO|nr:hypothetical protein [Deinococcus phoenicis]EYB66939.1 hypothetical protein DEIPH_ctg060orf0015 [Deinococcus phoenicis]
MTPKKDGTELLRVRISSDVAAFLKAKADVAGMPVTELGGALLEYAAQAEANEEGEALVLPTVRQVVRQELNLFLERIFELQVRTYMEAGTARRMVQAAMYYETPLPLEKIKAIEEKQWAMTWEASRKHLDGLLELKQLMGYSEGVFMDKNRRLATGDREEREANHGEV